jgi:radical SAM protein with 4Fe4S-binding SPASM domain
MAISEAHDFFIQWHLTERCNLRCTHCYQTGGRDDELSFDEISDVIAEVEDMFHVWTENYGMEFAPSFNITGGEPFLRNDLYDILSEIGSRGFCSYLLTNGTLIDKEKARRLSEFGVRGVQISIEGTQEIHDSIRGRGSFARSIEGTRHLLDHGLKVTLNATLSEINADSFMNMIELASSIGAQRLGFSRLVPSGRGKDLLKYMIETERVKAIYESIFSTGAGNLEIVTGDPLASQMHMPADESSPDVPSGGCAAGVSGLTFLADGAITPCRRMPVPIGNIRTDSIREVWATSKVLEMLRDRSAYKGRCGTCNRWSACRGCRAIAYAWSQAQGKDDILADDPQCFVRIDH